MDPLDAIPPLGLTPLTPPPPARVLRADRDEQHLPPDRHGGHQRRRDGATDEEDPEDFYEESVAVTPLRARPERRKGEDHGPHIDISA